MLIVVVSEGVDEDGNSAECSAATADGKSCGNPDQERVCGIQSRCGSVSGSIYRHGGSAQAYKPNAPLTESVCDTSSSSSKQSQPLVATWPFSRGRRKGENPTLHVRGSLWTCSTDNDQCCCKLLENEIEEMPVVEVWQARTDGTYSAISSQDSRDCRATVPMKSSSLFEFDTLLPGSMGLFGGLGPFGLDFPPYGPPLIHFLITTPEYEPLLVSVPVLADRSLQPSSFWGPDLRGHSLASPKTQSDMPYELSSWAVKGSEVNLDIDFFLVEAVGSASLEHALCPSSMYGLSSSFFFEPIAICAPSILDFFKL